MNPSLLEIESSLFKSLKSVSCQPVKNICNIESDVTLKDILTNATYLEEKLNLFIWLMFKFEPKFASDFVDIEFYTIDLKCKKIIEGLYSLGLINPSDFTVEKLINTTGKFYKTTLLILDDLNNLLQNKLISQFSSADDIFSYDLIASGAQQFHSPNADSNYFDELFAKKIQLFDDNMLIKEYRTVIQPHSSLLPSDLNRMIKTINENSSYLDNFQYTKTMKKEELIEFLNKEISNLETQIEQRQKNTAIDIDKEPEDLIADTNKDRMNEPLIEYNADLIETTRLLKDFNQFVSDVQNSLNSSKNNNSTQLFDMDCFGVESNLGKNFQDLTIVTKKLKEISKLFSDWSKFITQQSKCKQEYQESSLFLENDIDKIKFEMNQIENQLKGYLNILGYDQSTCTKANSGPDQTIVDKLLML